jgi:hypothetical protein
MKNRIHAAAAVVVLLSPLPAFAHSITVVERATSDAVTETGEKGDTVGDILTFANDLFDKDNKEKIGTDNGYCLRTVVGKAWECAWTNVLKEGQIAVQGTFLDGQDSVLTITGGTGRYVRTHGEMKLHARDAKGSEYDFTFDLR